jgi:ubiquinone/menaquinone biosynthesis C-methylase UbiE
LYRVRSVTYGSDHSDHMGRSTIPKTDYSKIADYYDKVRPRPADALVSEILEYGQIGAHSTVLDVGCGTGRFPLSLLAAKLFTLFALEPSAEMLRQAFAKDRSKRVLWVRGAGQSLPFQEGYFDCVYMTSVIHHIENKRMALQEIHRVLKEGGHCVILTFSHSGLRKHVIHDFPGVTAIDSERIPTVPCLKNMMREIGFDGVSYHAVELDEGYTSVDEYLKRVRSKYLSTLTVLKEDAFEKGLKIFERRIRKKYGGQIRRISRFVIIIGQK